MVTFPNAKINLGLDIVSKRPDGYHNLETVFYPIPLHDVLEITPETGNDAPACNFTMYNAVFEGDSDDNLVVKAYKILAADYTLPKVKISLYKNIPTGAGLGGGSSDAAFALKMLNDIAALGLEENKLEEYAARIGADCAFFIKNIPAYATGIGNILSPTTCDIKGYWLLLVKPEIHISTKDAYSLVVPAEPETPLKEIAAIPISDWKGKMKNDFEKSVFAKHPSMKKIKDDLYTMGAVYASMSGSGSAFFGIFDSEPDMKETRKHFVGMFCQCHKL